MILPSLKHLRRLTDDTGVSQFAVHSVPDPRFGYTLDDNARALLVTSMYYHRHADCDDATILTYKYRHGSESRRVSLTLKFRHGSESR